MGGENPLGNVSSSRGDLCVAVNLTNLTNALMVYGFYGRFTVK